MHEASIMESVFDIAFAQLQVAGAQRINRLILRVGRLSGVVPEALQFAFEAMKAGTPADQAVLEIDEVAIRLRCQACRHEFEAFDFCELCPQCQSWQTEVLQGRELDLVSLDVTCY